VCEREGEGVRDRESEWGESDLKHENSGGVKVEGRFVL